MAKHALLLAGCPSDVVVRSRNAHQSGRQSLSQTDSQSVSQSFRACQGSEAARTSVAMCCVDCQRAACCVCVCVKALNLYGSASCQSHLQTVTHAAAQAALKLELGCSWRWSQQTKVS